MLLKFAMPALLELPGCPESQVVLMDADASPECGVVVFGAGAALKVPV